MARGFLAAAARALATVITNVAADPRKLKPGELCRILNSTPLGPVIDDRRLRGHRTRGGLRIGEGSSIDLFRYAAWLAERFIPADAAGSCAAERRDPAAATLAQYRAKNDAERDRQASISRQGRDIGPPPPVADPKRRAKAEKSLQLFCESYFPERFKLRWSKDHLKVIQRLQHSVLTGGRFALGMPRGSGKTSLCEVAAIWALFIGARQFVMLIGASAETAQQMLDAIKMEIEANELLAADFPEVCYPIQRLEGRANMCAGQHIGGERTHICYGKKQLVLPTVAGSKASGAILRVRGIIGATRGAKFTRSDGTNARPDLVIIDDPQTDASAKSELQCTTREKLIAGAILGMAGPGKKIAAMMPCTVIRRGDMADNALTREKHPEWQGERCKMVYKWPTNEKLWDEYAEVRRLDLINGGDGSEAKSFYKKHFKEMNAGAEVAWPDRFNEDELSALQNAMNLRIADEATFFAEYQNEPLSDTSAEEDLLSKDAIASKVNGLARGVVPLNATRITSYWDVQHRLLYWVAIAWADGFNGSIIDYGTWPQQSKSHFTYRGVQKTLQQVYKVKSAHAAVLAGLTALSEYLLPRSWKNEAGTELRIERALVDAADGNLTDTVFEFCRRSPYASTLLPAIGKGINPSEKPMHEYKPKEGERLGFHCLLQPVPKRGSRQLVIDTNFWKSFVHERFAVPKGDAGCMTLFGTARSDHRMFAEHMRAEGRVRMRNEKTKLVVDVWSLPPAKPDNHLFDCASGAAAAAAMQGVSLSQMKKVDRPKSERQNVTYL